MEHLIFKKIPELRIIVCRQCEHAVHPKEVDTHLRKKHHMKTAKIQPILRTIQQWNDISGEPDMVYIPRELDGAIPIIKVHTNGMQCRQDPQCQYIGTHINTMRKHWQQVHGWTQHPHRGHVTAEEKRQGVVELQQSYRRVAWQQVFPTRKNSHLVHIRSLNPEPEELPTPVNERQRIAAEIKARAVEDEQHVADNVVEADEIHDANPWLRMTRWARYLADVHFQDLLDVVATPDAELADPVSRATRVVWDTMAQLARRSQQTVKHCGNGIRMAAVCTMPNHTPHQPLRAYMDEKSIQDHVRPWQQILLFVIRTQTSWPWTKKKPTYVMTARQQKTWRRLWQMAQAELERQIELDLGRTMGRPK
ncbi:uncharacterized protein BDW70DRAFT_146292 [Aspergillus foveolatus]|uniref:uncharacterized protein n=1 Tax=Aspergillus foveolatus TaxID=210207 RepID=UPI003CCDCE81